MNNNSHETPDSAPSEVINFDEEVRKRADVALEAKHKHEMIMSADDHPEDVDQDELRATIMKRLDRAEGAAARGKVMQAIFDTYGLDAVLGFFFPEVGDAAVSATLFTYFFGEAVYADLPKKDMAKLAWYQLVDFAIGAIPIVGDVGDYFYKANKYSAELFTAHRDKLVEAALEAGIPQEEIEHLLTAREELSKSISGAARMSGKVVKPFKRGGSSDAPEAAAA
jgi:hypothetical protein